MDHPAGARRRTQRAFEQRLRRIGDHLVRVERPRAPQTGAVFAGAERAVKRKGARFQFRNARATLHAGQFARVEPLFAAYGRDQNQTVGQLDRSLDGCLQSLVDPRLYPQLIHNHFDRVVPPLIEIEFVFERPDDAVDSRLHETLPRQFLQILFEFAFSAANNRSHDQNSVFRAERENVLQNLFRRLPGNLAAAGRAVRDADGGVQKPQIVVNFRDRADRAARAASGGFLVDGNGRAQTVDGIDIGPLHLIEKLPGIGRQRFDVPPLAFRVNGVERQRRLSRSAQASNHRQTIPRNAHTDVLQVVLPRAGNCYIPQHSVKFVTV